MKETDMREPPSPEYLGAFLDGELTADERAHVLALLESDAAFKIRVCELRTLKEMVKGAYGELPAASARGRRPPFPGVPQALAAGVLLVLGLGAGWMARDFSAPVPGYDRLAGLPAGYQAIALSEQVDSGKIILHLDSGEPGRLDKVLDLAEKLVDRQPAARIEIIANSYGLDLLRADVTPLRERIESMARRHANLSFVACGQTVARLTREGVKVDLLPVAHTATSAINEIMTRMGQGWVYVKV